MKKILYSSTFVLLFCLISAPAIADFLVIDIDDPNNILSDVNQNYWTEKDKNASDEGQLKNSEPTTEEAWLEALLGLGFDDPTISFINKFEFNKGYEPKILTSFEPAENINPDHGKWEEAYEEPFNWYYAVVKYGQFWSAYADTDSDGLLTTSEFPKGISHVSFFEAANLPPGPGPDPVPEPATMVLLGFGLIGMAAVRRKFKKL